MAIGNPQNDVDMRGRGAPGFWLGMLTFIFLPIAVIIAVGAFRRGHIPVALVLALPAGALMILCFFWVYHLRIFKGTVYYSTALFGKVWKVPLATIKRLECNIPLLSAPLTVAKETRTEDIAGPMTPTWLVLVTDHEKIEINAGMFRKKKMAFIDAVRAAIDASATTVDAPVSQTEPAQPDGKG